MARNVSFVVDYIMHMNVESRDEEIYRCKRFIPLFNNNYEFINLFSTSRSSSSWYGFFRTALNPFSK